MPEVCSWGVHGGMAFKNMKGANMQEKSIESKVADIIYRYFGHGWNKHPEQSPHNSKNFKDCAKEVIKCFKKDD